MFGVFCHLACWCLKGEDLLPNFHRYILGDVLDIYFIVIFKLSALKLSVT